MSATEVEYFSCTDCYDEYPMSEVGVDMTRPGIDPVLVLVCRECVAAKPFSMDDLAAKLQDRGIPAKIEMTGGGVATLYAGELVHADEDNPRYVAIVGPGNYGYGVEPSTGFWDELSIAADDDYTTDGIYWDGERTLDAVADFIADHMDKYRQAVAAFVSANA
jgi:hypothetical protein